MKTIKLVIAILSAVVTVRAAISVIGNIGKYEGTRGLAESAAGIGVLAGLLAFTILMFRSAFPKQRKEVGRTAPIALVQTKTTPAIDKLSRVDRRLVIVAVLGGLLFAAAAYVGADWYYGLPVGAEAKFVGRQSC